MTQHSGSFEGLNVFKHMVKDAVSSSYLYHSNLAVFDLDYGHYSLGQPLLWRTIVFADNYYLAFFEVGHSVVTFGFALQTEDIVPRPGRTECLQSRH